jgi:hypothetical protein
MRLIKTIQASVVFSIGIALASQAQFIAKITVNSGNLLVVDELNIRADRLYTDTGQASTPVSSIEKLEFRYSGIDLDMCEAMFRSGDRSALESLLEQYVGPTLQYSDIPGNISDYMEWILRVQIWNHNYSGAEQTIGSMRNMADGKVVDFANLYFVYLLLEQNKAESAKTVFDQITDPDAISIPMAEYIRGRMAAERGDYRLAMQHVSTVLAFHSRDFEWMPPATALEARVYTLTGQLKKAETIANELSMAYPGTRWSELGENIMKEVQQ